MDYQPFISIIIPTFNSEKTLDFCLSSALSLNYLKDKLEIIIVDNGSKDNTVQIAKKYEVKIFIKPKITISSLRNWGAKMAKGDIFAFTDSDCIVSKDWINNALLNLERETVGAAGCGYDSPVNASWVERSWARLKNLEAHEVNFLPGGNLIVKKEPFLKLGGFSDELITGEDYEFCKRLMENGYKLISDNKIKVIHLGNPKTLYAFLKREIWYGMGMLGTKKGDKWNKPFIISNIYLLSFIGLIIYTPISVYLNKFLPLIFPISFIVLIPLISSLRRSIQSKNLGIFPLLIPIYFSYCLGRMISLFYIYKLIREK